jgi:hypothetical protein
MNQTTNPHQKSQTRTYSFNEPLYLAYAMQEFYWERIIIDREKPRRGEQLPPLSWQKFCYWTDEIERIMSK